MRTYIWIIPQPKSLNFGKALENVRELLVLTKFNYADFKRTMIADIVSFNQKRDRDVSDIKRRNMILRRSLAPAREKTADNKLVKLTNLEETFTKVYTLLGLPVEGKKVVPVLVLPDTLKLIKVMVNTET